MKRSFIRRNGTLIDRSSGADGRPAESHMPASFLDEAPTGAERAKMIVDIAAGGARAHEPAYALHASRNADVLDALLQGLDNGSDPSLGLLRHLDDARVRPALLKAAARETHEMAGNVYQVLGLLGGPEATALLSTAISKLLAEPATFEDDPFCNFAAGNLVARPPLC